MTDAKTLKTAADEAFIANTTPEYRAAYYAHRDAVAAYNVKRDAYRAGTIADLDALEAEYLAARAAWVAACAAIGEVERNS